jgi:hypothetical protein
VLSGTVDMAGLLKLRTPQISPTTMIPWVAAISLLCIVHALVIEGLPDAACLTCGWRKPSCEELCAQLKIGRRDFCSTSGPDACVFTFALKGPDAAVPGKVLYRPCASIFPACS